MSIYEKYIKYKTKYLKLKTRIQHNSQFGGNINNENCELLYTQLHAAVDPEAVYNLYNTVVPFYGQTWNKINMPSRLIKRDNFHIYKQIIQNYLDKMCMMNGINRGYPTSPTNPNMGYPVNSSTVTDLNNNTGNDIIYTIINNKEKR